VVLPARMAILCPEECRCDPEEYHVICYNTSLTTVPSIRLTDVRILGLRHNNITLFEKDSFVSRGLTEQAILQVGWCELRTIELGAFNGLTKLRELSLWHEELYEIIQGTFENMNNLKFLSLLYNRLEHLDSDVFSGLVNLERIYLAENKLKYLHPETFLGSPNIQHTILGKNPGLQILTDRNFINSHSLSYLGISFCDVSSVSVATFANVSALERLELRRTGINIFTALPKLSALHLYGNPLQCDCQMQEVWRWCQDRNIRTASGEREPECDTPSEVKGIWWGVLEKGRCLRDNIQYYGDYKNTSYSYSDIDSSYLYNYNS
jgi:hypothetical protein